MECDDKYKGKCITCGFAAKRARIILFTRANREYFELPFDERQQNVLPSLSTLDNSVVGATDIACFRGKVDLLSLVKERIQAEPPTVPKEETREKIRQLASKLVLQATGCDAWFPYEPGRTPQEHLGDFMWERLEQQRQQYERERENDRREFEERLSSRAEGVQLQLAARNEELQKQHSQEQGRNANLITKITIFGIILASIQVLTLTKDSLLWKLIVFCYNWIIG